MGGTIIAGAVTTAGSGASMFPGIIQFFYKMALLIVLTICFSLGYALFFFMPLVLVAGPDKGKGDIAWLSKGEEGRFKQRSTSKAVNDHRVAKEIEEGAKSAEMVLYKKGDEVAEAEI